jgi:3-dehydroquinate synthase
MTDGDLQRVAVRAGERSYQAVVGVDLANALPDELLAAGLKNRLRLVVDRRISATHAPPVVAALQAAGRDVSVLEIEAGEQHKTLASISAIFDWLIEVGTDRRDALLAMGGGVVGDMVGFAAASYLRGIRLVQLPTTLLAMVDSSIGGKTGVNHPKGKNLIGAFYQPSLVMADLRWLESLPAREQAAGWAEIVKMGIIRDANLFDRCETIGSGAAAADETAQAIARSIELKGDVVAADERESDLRMLLNYGHTIGHAIEAATDYGQYLHGEAVAIGMRGAGSIAVALGLLRSDELERQQRVLRSFGLPDRAVGVEAAQVWEPMRRDKKAVGARLRWVMPTRIGDARVVDDIPESVVQSALDLVVTAGG